MNPKTCFMNYGKKQRFSSVPVTGMALLAMSFQDCRSPQEDRSGPREPRLNFLCIVTEDISPYLHCFGDSIALTPNLDRLAREGVKFTNVFSVSGVCAPSRAALITGMYPVSFGAQHMRTNRENLPDNVPPYEAVPPAEVKCYTEFLRVAGYYCVNNSKEDYQFDAPVTAWDESSAWAHWRNRPEGKAFFAIFNIGTTHESQVWDRANDPLVIKPEAVKIPPFYPDTRAVRRDISRVYANVTVMDREVGEILNQLREDGLMDSTIIIFYSDNGGPLPRGKRDIYDSGLKVPMIIRFPEKKHAGKVVRDLISFVDLPPTWLSLAGVEVPEYMQGQVFWGSQKAASRNYIYAARDRMDSKFDTRRAVRNHEYKYIRNFHPEIPRYLDIQFRKKLEMMQDLLHLRDDGKLNPAQMHWFAEHKPEKELYHLPSDPWETNNLAGKPEYEELLSQFRKMLKDWMEEIDDPGAISEKELVWSMWPEGEQPLTDDPVIQSRRGKVSIKCKTDGASIGYIINRSRQDRPQHWRIYQGSFDLEVGDTLTVVTHRIGYKPSKPVIYVEK